MRSSRQLVCERASNRCEYCKVHLASQCATFHIDHVHPTSRGGADDPTNLALSCPLCNLSKSNRLFLRDEQSGAEVPIFNPRRDNWPEHFRFEGTLQIGLTPTGRSLVTALDLNSAHRQFIRTIESEAGLFPPEIHNGTEE